MKDGPIYLKHLGGETFIQMTDEEIKAKGDRTFTAKEVKDILTKVYGFSNQIKVSMSLEDGEGAWKSINLLNDYLVSVNFEKKGGETNDNSQEEQGKSKKE